MKKKNIKRLYNNPFLPDFEGEQIPSRYTIQDFIFKGAYGTVLSAIDNRTNKEVVIKKCEGVLQVNRDDGLDCNILLRRMFNELELLLYFQTQNVPHIVSLLDLFRDGDTLYLVFEKMLGDLKDHLRNARTSDIMDEPLHKKRLLYNVLQGIKECHERNIVHRDLKPRNCLINKDTLEVKICDFGLSEESSLEKQTNELVVTRWYRSFENLLEYNHNHQKALDMWSYGCMFAEIIQNGKILFPGKNELHQIQQIQELLGHCHENDLFGCEQGKKYLENLHIDPLKQKRNYFKLKYQINDINAFDLLKKCLNYNPYKRISAEEALEHPYFQELHETKKDEKKNKGGGVKVFKSSFDDEWTVETIKKKIMQMVDVNCENKLVIVNSKHSRSQSRSN